MDESSKPQISCSKNGPYIVKNLENLENSRGQKLPAKSTMALCRCGGSGTKPFCDGTHKKNGFSGDKLTDGSKDKRDNYIGMHLTIHDNRGICAHIGKCTDGLPAVFRLSEEPWINPSAANGNKTIETIKQCPSGALSYSVGIAEHRDHEREAKIYVSKNGPYFITGGIELPDEKRNAGASKEHYALCRCGASKNKPFCDGSHWRKNFKDENN
jgi:CDGSH-type Zn-finger protein